MKEETVIGVLLRFLEGDEARAKTFLISKKVEGGGVVLSSYGVPIAELREGEVVIKYAKWNAERAAAAMGNEVPHSYARRKHGKWLAIIAYEKGFRVEYEGY